MQLGCLHVIAFIMLLTLLLPQGTLTLLSLPVHALAQVRGAWLGRRGVFANGNSPEVNDRRPTLEGMVDRQAQEHRERRRTQA